MLNILINWLVSGLVVFAASYLLPGVHIEGFFTALVVALILGILNALVKPVLFLLTLPITLLTLGMFMFVLNALLVLLTSALVPGFKVDGFLWAMIFSLVISIFGSFTHILFKNKP